MISTNVTRLSNISIFVGNGSIGDNLKIKIQSSSSERQYDDFLLGKTIFGFNHRWY